MGRPGRSRCPCRCLLQATGCCLAGTPPHKLPSPAVWLANDLGSSNSSSSPSTHMMFDAMTALLSLPRVTSHRLSRSRITVTRNLQGEAGRRVSRAGGDRQGQAGAQGLGGVLPLRCGP